MNTDFAIVTSLYNVKELQREDGRNWEDYVEWFCETLNIKCPFIIFTEEDLVDTIKKARQDLPTEIYAESLEDIPYYHLKQSIQDVLDSDFYKENMSDTNRVECKNSMYSVIQYSKFKWLKKASEINPFNSKFFFWLDAGASRFLYDCDTSNEYPSENALKELEGIDNTMLIQYNTECYTDLVNSEILSEKYLWDNRSFICGSMFGGNKIAIENISLEIDNLIQDMLQNKNFNNEQIAIGYLCKNKENLFTRFYRVNGKNHLSLFQEMV
ncbi:MAG: WlaTC/HtrL family glycosyltransferase [Candidatus Fonsibacter ubiquis]